MWRTLLGCAVAGCASPAVPFEPDASFDAGFEVDAGEDAAPDVAVADAGVDVFDAGSFDAGPPCTCDEHVCASGHCEGSRCVLTPHARGAACGESGVCAEGACFVRFGCGDGFRELSGEAREGCDDGNEVDGDGCDACMPRVVDFDADSPVLTATDPWGWTLFVWTERDAEGWRVLGRRHRRVGGFEADFVIAEGAGGVDPSPAVVALRTGWVVAHHVSDEDVGDLAFAVLDHESIVERETLRRPSRQRQVQLFRVERGFGAVWNDEEEGEVWARLFEEDLRPRSAPIRVGSGDSPSVASEGRWLVAWTHSTGEGPRLRSRLFVGDRGSAVSELGVGFAPSVARDVDGWLVAYASRERDGRGDVYLATLNDAGEPTEGISIAATEEAELAPRLASLNGSTVVLFERGTVITGTVRDVGASASAAPPELATLTAALAGEGRQTRPAIAPAGDALWVTWMNDADERGARAFRLPVDGW